VASRCATVELKGQTRPLHAGTGLVMAERINESWTDEPVGLREGTTVECPQFCGLRRFFPPHTDQDVIDAEVQRHVEEHSS
jgi:hypothetical protein